MPALVATPNASNANSFLLLAEAQTYWETRLWSDMWNNSIDQTAALILATRTLSALLMPRRQFVPPGDNCECGYFINHPTWTGLPATSTQALPWGRSGMFDANGNVILSTVIPQALKDATAELAGQMSLADRLIDSDVAVQGITSVKAGSVAVTFDRGSLQTLKVLPDIVLAMLVPSWLTNLTIEGMYTSQFDVISS